MKILKQDLLIFIGTIKEVIETETIDKCFYFAWDTGEMFLGNPTGTKTKYGGSAKTLGVNDIRNIVDDYVSSSVISEIRSQIGQVGVTVQNYKQSVERSIIALTEAANRVAIDTRGYVNDAVTERLPSFLGRYYSIDDIDGILNRYVKTEDFQDLLHDYTELVPRMATGQQLYETPMEMGYYICSSNYRAGTTSYYAGYIYYVSSSGQVVVVATGGGGGGGSSEPTIVSFKINNVNYFVEESLSQILSGDSLISYTLKNGSLFESLRVYYDTYLATSDLTKEIENSKTFDFSSDSFSKSVGRHVIKLLGTYDNSGVITTIDSKINLDIVRPIYYGTGNELAPVNMSKKIKTNPTDSYEITTTNLNPCIWIGFPSGDFVDSMVVRAANIKSNGFTVGTTTILSPGSYENYVFYRTDPLLPNTMVIDVQGTGGAVFNG